MRFPMVAALVAVLAAAAAVESHAAAGIPGLHLVSADASGVTLEYRLEGYERDTVETPAGPRLRLRVTGFGASVEEGKPALPVGGVWVALPPTGDASVQVLQDETESVDGIDLVPVYRSLMAGDPKLGEVPSRDYFVDEQAYASNEPYPGALAEIAETSWMRFQRVAALRLHPLRYRAASRTLLVTRRLVVRVQFGSLLNRGTTAMARAGLEPGPRDDRQFESIYRGAVLNYDQGRGWRARRARRPEVTPAGEARSAPVGALGLGTGNPEWKVRVDTTGVWRVTYEQLVAKSWPAGIGVDAVTAFRRDTTVALDPEPWTATEIPIDVVDRNSNSVFDAGDFIVLPVRNWAERVLPGWYERRYGDAEVVWLSYKNPGGLGMRVASRPGFFGAQNPAVPANFPSFRHYERNFIYFSYPLDVTTHDQFYWTDPNNPDPIDTLFADLLDLDATGPNLTVSAQWNGMRVGTHYVSGTWVNGSGTATPLWTEAPFNDRNILALTAPVTAAQASPGLNHLRIQGHGSLPNPPGSGAGFNWMDVTYPRLFRARNNRLDFNSGSASDTVRFVVDGFAGGSKPPIYAYDVTDWSAPVRLTVDPAQVEASGGGWRATLESVVAAGTPGHIVAAADVSPLPDAAITSEVTSSLYLTPPGGADLVIIVYDDFEPAVEPLASHRRQQGIGTLVAKVQDVYDEFNGGRKSQFAIRRFLRYALEHWDTRFVLLVGDASEDGQKWLGTSDVDYVPTALIPGPVGPGTGLGLEIVPSDNWYGFALAGGTDTPGRDKIADLVIGRWTAGSLAETQALVTKELDYENGPQDESWRSRAVLIADDDYSSATTFGGPAPTCPGGLCYCLRSSERVFRSIDVELEKLIQVEAGFRNFDVRRFYLADLLASIKPYSESSCPEGVGRDFFATDSYVDGYVSPPLFALMSEGACFLNFQGHANRFQMTHESLYLANDGLQDIDLIANNGKPWIFSGYACHLNNFASVVESTPFGDGLAERMVNAAGKGAIASFASVGYELLPFDAANQLNVHFYRAFFADPPYAPFAGRSGARVYVGEAMLLGVARMVVETGGLESVAGRTYVLLGDPLTNVNFGPPQLFASASDRDSIGDSSPYYSTVDQDTVQIDVEAIDESAIDSLTVFEQGEGVSGTVPPSELIVTPSFPDSIGNRYVITRRVAPRPASYDVTYTATDRSGLKGRFVLRFLLEAALTQGKQTIRDGDPALADEALVWRVRSPGRLLPNDFQVLVDGAPVSFNAERDPADTTGRSWNVSFTPDLSQGSHRADIQVALARGGVTRGRQFVVSPDGLDIKNAYAFPNPFRDETFFSFSVNSNRLTDVLLRVFTVSGTLVYERRERDLAPGYYQWKWDGRDQAGQDVANGVYIFRIASVASGNFESVAQGKIARAPKQR